LAAPVSGYVLLIFLQFIHFRLGFKHRYWNIGIFLAKLQELQNSEDMTSPPMYTLFTLRAEYCQLINNIDAFLEKVLLGY